MHEDKLILFVDDDPDISALYSSVFTRSGLKFVTAQNGKTAQSIIQDKKPFLVLLDIMLPDVNGLDILKNMKESDQTRSIVVWILSNLGDIDTRTKATELGANDYLIKAQYTPNQVVDKINAYFNTQNL